MTQPHDDSAWDDPDRAVQFEDSNPESLAGDEVEFNPEADDDEPEDFPSTPSEFNAGVANLPAGGSA